MKSDPSLRSAPLPKAANAPNAEYFPVPIDALSDLDLTVDLFLKHGDASPVLYRGAGSSYSVSDCRKLAERGITHVFVRNTDHRSFKKLITERMSSVYDDPDLGRAERSRIVRDTCGQMIAELMQHGCGPSGEAVADLAGQFSQWCTEDESKFSYLLDMSEHDFYTITHMVNVGVGCGLLAAEMFGQDADSVRDLVHGGLVHDIGKRNVNADVLNKEGKLTDEEWLLIRSHPELGYAELAPQPDVKQVTLEMTLDHHERLDGKGYPRGLTAEQISVPARVCAVVDVYDALTAARPYRGPIPPLDVLNMMREDVGSAFDPEVFAAWERVVHRLIDRDPDRATKTGTRPVPTLDELIPQPANEALRLSTAPLPGVPPAPEPAPEPVAESVKEAATEAAEPAPPPPAQRGCSKPLTGAPAPGTPEPVRAVYLRTKKRAGPIVGKWFETTLIGENSDHFELRLENTPVIGDIVCIQRDIPGKASRPLTGVVEQIRYGPHGEPLVLFKIKATAAGHAA